MLKTIFALLLTVSLGEFAYAEDPFKNITLHKFNNGLKVILAPDPKSEFVQVKVNVGVGHYHEDFSNYGISHLLEHVLFRNSKLKDDMSYLQIIKEKDGTANGTTSWDQTSYFATVKKENGRWLVNLFHEMIMTPTLDPKHVETEKKTVLLEIGEPSPFEKAIGINLYENFSLDYLHTPDFWEKYFKVRTKSRNSRTSTRLRTLTLNKKQIDEHYKKYYDPSNMQIIVSGNFHPEQMISLLVDLWAKYPTKNIGDQRPKYNSQDPKHSYQSDDVGSRPRIKVGYLVNKISPREKEVLLSYTEYLSHRLMKKLRNLHGETYTVYDNSGFKQDFGFFAVNMQTSKGKFHTNLKLIQSMLKDEVENGKLSDEDIEEAKRLYLNGFMNWSQTANGLSKMAERMFEMNELSGLWETPRDILNNVSSNQYRLILRKYGRAQTKYEALIHPELLFTLDYALLFGLCAIGIFFLFRRILQKPFKNDHVRWVRKVRFPPLKIMELLVGAIIILACFHTGFLAQKLTDAPAFSRLGILSFYLEMPIWIFTAIATAQVIISYFPRKLYVVDDSIVVKSLSYFSFHIPLNEIRSVEDVSVFKVLFSPGMWPKLWNSFHYYDPWFWKKGILITLKSGKLYFYSTKDSNESAKELTRFLEGINEATDQKEESLIELKQA
jgi:predicted Zn-dependent peptidase